MSHNTFIHHLVRPAVRTIAPSGITPNQLTTARLIAGLGAAVCFATGTTFWADIGGLIFVASMLLDRADGELARQTGKSSLFGYRYDIVSDCVADLVTFVGVGVGVGAILGRLWLGPLIGLFVGATVVLLFWQLYVVKRIDLKGLSFKDGKFALDADDAMLMVPVLIWLGAAREMLCVAAVVAPLTALIIALAPPAAVVKRS
jgi:archaetidylinositol phosphate synthase